MIKHRSIMVLFFSGMHSVTEMIIKKEINVCFQVYTDVAEPKKTIAFDSVCTLQEMYEDQMKQTSHLHYYRIVGGFQRSGPLEKVGKC